MQNAVTLIKKLVDHVLCLCNKIPDLTTPIPVTIEGNTLEVDPSDAWQTLFDGLGDQVVASIEAQTASLSVDLQEICDKLDAGITVNAVQSGTWSVTMDGQPLSVELSPDNITDLVTALQDLQVKINGQPVGVNVTSQSDVIDVRLDPTSLSALENITVKVDNAPLSVTGTITVDEITNAITVDWTGVKDALDGLEVVNDFTDLTDWLGNNTLSVTLNGEELEVDVDDVVSELQTLVSEVDQVEELLTEIRDQNNPVVRTPARLVTTTDGSVSAGTISVSIHNHSNVVDAEVLGAKLPAGQTVTFSVDIPDTLATIPYITNGAELHINTLT